MQVNKKNQLLIESINPKEYLTNLWDGLNNNNQIKNVNIFLIYTLFDLIVCYQSIRSYTKLYL